MTYKRTKNYNPLKLPYINADVLTFRLIPEKSKVLDVGCGSGYLGKVMQEELGCTVTGVELDNSAGHKAQRYLNHVIIGNIEDPVTLNQIEQRGPYNIIFASAVFEHLVDPSFVIQKLSQVIAKNGFFIITLPNIAHYTVRFSLLTGHFDYTDSGILDRTHLHFYTQETARALFKNNGLTIVHEDIELFGPKPLSFLFKLCPGFFGYQFVFKAVPKKYEYKEK